MESLPPPLSGGPRSAGDSLGVIFAEYFSNSEGLIGLVTSFMCIVDGNVCCFDLRFMGCKFSPYLVEIFSQAPGLSFLSDLVLTGCPYFVGGTPPLGGGALIPSVKAY